MSLWSNYYYVCSPSNPTPEVPSPPQSFRLDTRSIRSTERYLEYVDRHFSWSVEKPLFASLDSEWLGIIDRYFQETVIELDQAQKMYDAGREARLEALEAHYMADQRLSAASINTLRLQAPTADYQRALSRLAEF